MIVRKITVCCILFALLVLGAAVLDWHVNRLHYPEPKYAPHSPKYNINTINTLETDIGTQSFRPREYIRIIQRSAD
ncbi:hypothetical protein SAMN05661091_2274 [Paenibacillus uliginis N3/975]|uniref:Uncharacterized protein n=1 Tax=Paenibacillus uliginis N3/975 TaxID=1313296 RepID=A0A1X7HAQ9_9BACL|nr:hypothetical protein [Paenibacillus uliginis]SMF82942.1 hypothetical protein SAMN05661091_2274 [Paenibacillus uliginis N3/975]